MTIRTRFAPSPTGELHVGGLRTALYAYLWARRNGGVFSLRIEDTDRARLVPGSADRMLALLRALGLTWDEGPDVGGPYGPYVQSERLDRYRAVSDTLLANGHAYQCDCSPERLRELRDAQTAVREPTRYDGHCRTRYDVDAATPHVVRFRIPESKGVVVARDIVHGTIRVETDTLDDFVLMKSDGFPTYHLAHVVDDHEMRTTHVIRGDEWLPSLPKHVLLLDALDWEVPEYAHLPLLLNPQHKKLSKRDGDVSVDAFLTWCLPEALLNFVALLGWNPSGDREVYSMDELVASFDLARVNASPAVADFEKLEWLNGAYIRRMDPEELTARIRARLPVGDRGPALLSRVVQLEQPRLRRLDRFPDWYAGPWHQEAPLADTRREEPFQVPAQFALHLAPAERRKPDLAVHRLRPQHRPHCV